MRNWAFLTLVGCQLIACRSTGSAPVSDLQNTQSADATLAPVPGIEVKPENENTDIQFVTQGMLAATRKDEKLGYAPRASAGKTHGCVLADFIVPGQEEIAASQMPYQLGVFRPGTRLKAWIRFSNSHGGGVQHDNIIDGRNMSIKLVGVPRAAGELSFLESLSTPEERKFEEANTQDFELINYPAFFAGNMRDMINFASNPQEYFKANPRKYEVYVKSRTQGEYSPLDNEYYSMTPFMLGTENVVKHSVQPIDCKSGKAKVSTPRSRDNFNYLRESMVAQLTEEKQCFAFRAHVRQDPNLQVEDSSEIWPESKAPIYNLARLEINPQTLTSDRQRVFCENLSYTIWHAIPEHRPVGGINRGRLHIYKAASKKRVNLNGYQKFEPTGVNDVERYPMPLNQP
jgi:hypothetical protein